MKNELISSLLTAPLVEDTGNIARGLIAASNESRFESANFSNPLTAYTVGWRDPENLDLLLEQLFPAVEVGPRFEFKKGKNAEAFLSELDDIRAIGSGFKKVEYTGDSVNEKTHNKGLTISVDRDSEVGPDWRERYTSALMQRLCRNDLRRGITILDAAATNQAKVWNAASNPDGDIRKAARLGKAASGLRPNQMAAGGALWDLRANAYEGQDTPKASRAADMTPEDLARKLMLRNVVISEMVYGGSTKVELIDSVAYLYYARSGLMKDDPSHMKRFVTPTPQGRFRVYVEEKTKFTDITVEHYSNIVATDISGIRKITATES